MINTLLSISAKNDISTTTKNAAGNRLMNNKINIKIDYNIFSYYELESSRELSERN